MSIRTTFRCDGCKAEAPEACRRGDVPHGWGVLTLLIDRPQRKFTAHWCPGCMEERATKLGLA